MIFLHFFKYYLAVLVGCLIAFSFVESNAQSPDSLNILTADGWIEQMNNYISADLSFNNTYHTFDVKAPSGRIILYPNSPNHLRLKASYDFISLGVQFAPSVLPGNGDENERGVTETFQFGTTVITRHWYADISYKKVKGFYLENTADYRSWMKGDAYIQFPDLYHRGFSLSSRFIENPKLSLRSLVSQTERQFKSAGSFTPVLNFDYYIVDDQSNASSTQKSKNIEAGIGPGYTHTIVFDEKFYLSLGMSTSAGYLSSRLTTRIPEGNIRTNQNNFVIRWDGQTGVGYNSERFYSGLYASVSGMRYKQENTAAINAETRLYYHLFFGMRFEAFEALKRFVTNVKRRVN